MTSPLQVAERSTQRWPNQYGHGLGQSTVLPNLGAFASLMLLGVYRVAVVTAPLPSVTWTMQSMQGSVTSSRRPLGQKISSLSTLEAEPRPRCRRRSEEEA